MVGGPLDHINIPTSVAVTNQERSIQLSTTRTKWQMTLKSTYGHYYQCMGLLLVTGKDWLDYILRSKKDIFVERITPE